MSVKRSSGFTLFEMLVVLFIVGLGLLTAGINFPEVFHAFSRNDARRIVLDDIERARQEAVTRGAITFFDILPGSNQFTINVDNFPYANPWSSDIKIIQHELPGGVTIELDKDIAFDSRGYVTDNQGDLTTIHLTLKLNGEPFYSGIIYPTGYVDRYEES